jgi:hypothetical protein
MPRIFNREELSNVVVNLRQNVGNGQSKVGTGIFVVHNQNELYLVTASHVANDMLVSGDYVIKGANDIAVSLKITDLIQGFSAQLIPWTHHQTADLAILRLNPTQQTINTHFQNRFLPSENINANRVIVTRDVELTSIGFPNGLGAVGHFSPLTFRTFASSSLITLNRADTQTPADFFVLENPSIGGYSGGPVFDISIYKHGAMTSTGTGTMCHGIMHGTISDQTGGKLAVVTPSYLLFDLI